MKKFKYTFLCPSYKTDYFKEALRSMLGQSNRNFKILVSDDCSPAPIYEIFTEVKNEVLPSVREQMTYRKNQKNIGGKRLVDHWNLLVDLCDTDYLIMASDDDLYNKNFLSEIDLLISKYPQVDLFCSRSERINQLGDVIARDEPTEEYETQIDFLYGLYFLHRIKCIGNYVFKTSALRQVGGFLNFPYAWGSDDATASLLSRNGIAITPHVLFSFRLSGENISTRFNRDVVRGKIKARMENVEWFEGFTKTIRVTDNLIETNRLKEYKSFYFNEWTRSVKMQSEFLCIHDAFASYKWLTRKKCFGGILERIHFWHTWLMSHIMKS